jgi:hypothetical protein
MQRRFLLNRSFSASSVLCAFTAALAVMEACATVDDALAFALEAATPYVEQGFVVREDYWGGDLPVKQPKAISHQLFRGLEYWFWVGTDVESAKISVNIYDSDGNLVNAEQFQKGKLAGARVVPKRTGSYFIIVEVLASTEERTPWGLAYGYR